MKFRLTNKKSQIAYTCAFLFISLITFNVCHARDIVVCPDCGIKSIKKAIEIAKDGDRLLIKSGYYKEHNIYIDKSIELIGEGQPVIDCEYKDKGILIQKNNVKVPGITIKNTGKSNMDELAAIKIYNSKNCLVENNYFPGNYFAIYLANSSYCVLKNNKIHSTAETETSSGNGIHIWKCNNILIAYNDISGHRDGIYFEFVENTTITGNVSHNNLRYGLHFMFSHGNVYTYNTFRENGAGVAVMYTRNVEMRGNIFDNNWGASSYGLLLKEISDSRIYDNLFYKNTVAIFMEGSTRIDIHNNTLQSNGWALKIMGNCYDNSVYFNNFTGNTFDVSTNSSKSLNVFYENYWDKYDGYDLNHDGIGDVPYRPVSLYAMMVEKVPESILLLRSFIVNLLDATEKVIPTLIPEMLIDNKPRMNKIPQDLK